MLFYLLGFVSLLLYIWFEIKKLKFKELYQSYNGDDKVVVLPILGVSHYFIGSNEKRCKSLMMIGRKASEVGGAIFFWLGHYPFLVLTDAELIGVILKTNLDKGDTAKVLRSVIGNGLAHAPVPIWHSRRKIMAPTFGTSNIREHFPIFQKKANILMEQLKPNVGRVFPVLDYIYSYTLDGICEAVFTIDLKAQSNQNQPFLKAYMEMCKMIAERLTQPWLHSEAIYRLLPKYKKFKEVMKILYDTVDEVLEGKRKEMNNVNNDNNKKMKSFSEMLLEESKLKHGNKNGYSHEELREETMALTIGGIDTTTGTFAYILTMLAKHQDVQDKIYKEIHDIFGDSDKPVEPEDLKRLEYTELVIKEALRLYSVVPCITRKITEEVTMPNGVVMPRGCNVLINIWALHRNPKYWGDDAEEFKPERFRNIVKHPAQYIPFSYGPRNCVAGRYGMMLLKTTLVKFLQNYRLLPPSKDDPPLKFSYEVSLKDLNKYCIRIDFRNKDIINN